MADKEEDIKAEETRLSPAEERVKAYLESQIKEDAALAALYAPSRIKDCFQYITAEARKKVQGGSYFADDAEVWKWARDYFIEELPKKAAQMPPEVAEKKAAGEAEAEKAETAAETESPAGDNKELLEVTDNENAGTPCEEAAAMPGEAAEGKEDTTTDEYGFEVYGEEEDCGAETEPAATTDNTEPEAAEQTDENLTVFDKDGNGLLFDF